MASGRQLSVPPRGPRLRRDALVSLVAYQQLSGLVGQRLLRRHAHPQFAAREVFPGYCTDVFFNQAQRWIAEGPSNQPFFAYIPLNSAHWPWFVPDHYREPIRRSLAEHPELMESLNEQRRNNLISFLAMGANIDENVGRLDEFLRDQRLFDNTIVVFLTDNGSTMGPDYFNAGMRGSKTTLWEGGHRVPCFIRWPASLDRAA
ncbi:MAG: sulfatase-like hydrolase/transferase [Pirellulaceae bacterium]